MVRNSSLHCGSHPERLMHAAHIEKDHVKIDCGFQVFQRFTETQGKPRKAPQVCAHAQIGPFHMASRDVAGIGVSADWDRDCGFYLRGAVPVRGFAVRSSVQFQKLREVNASTEVLFDGRNVSAQSVRCDLESPRNALAQIADKLIGTCRVSLRGQIGQNKLGFAVNRHPDVGISPLSGIIRRKMACFGVDKGPEFVSLHKSRVNSAHSAVKQIPTLLTDSQKQRENRALVDASETRHGADTHSFHKQTDYLRCFFGLDVVASEWFIAGFGESSFAGLAAETLNSQSSVRSKTFCCAVLASNAGHWTFSLVFLREKSDNQSLGSECRLRPRLDSPPPLAQTSGGVIASTEFCNCLHRYSSSLIGSLICQPITRAFFRPNLNDRALIGERFHYPVQARNPITRLLQAIANLARCDSFIVTVSAL